MANIILTRSNLRDEVVAALERSKQMPPRKKAAPKPKAKPKKTGRFTAVNFTRKWLYGPNDLSKIIETADEYQSLIKKGWQDHPFKK